MRTDAAKASKPATEATERDLEHKLAVDLSKTLNAFVRSLNKE